MRRWSNAGWQRRFWRTEKNFRRIMGWKDLWQLEAILGTKITYSAAAQQEARKMNPSAAPRASNYERDTVISETHFGLLYHIGL
jgi:hypothetical protein